MGIFSPKTGGNNKTIPVLLTLILSGRSALGGTTNEMSMELLPAGGKYYTNATITRVTPAYAVVSYQEGMVQIPMSNMPAAFQIQSGYTPEKAAQFLDVEAQNQKNRRAAVLARQAAFQTQAGTNRPVRITAIDDNPAFGGLPFCSVDGINSGILVENLPDSLRQFMTGYRQLQADIADCNRRLDNLKVATTPPAQPVPQPQMGKTLMIGNSAGFVRAYTVQKDNPAAGRRNVADQLNVLNARLDQATVHYNHYTTIMAHPSGQSYGGIPIWVCVGIPAGAPR